MANLVVKGLLIVACVDGTPKQPPKPLPFRAETPTRGVSIAGNLLLEPIMQANVDYLLTSFDVDHLLHPFRQRAGKEAPVGSRPLIKFWDTDLRGSNAGRFLMGAGNTLRWIENAELRKMMNEVVDGVEECQNKSNGYILAFEPNEFMHSEEGDYSRSWFTQGLIEAGKCGNDKVWSLLRDQYDWFDDPGKNMFLPYLYDGVANGEQGQIASTRVYLETPVGVYKDSQVAQDTYRDNFWMRQLIARNATSISDYHMPAPHRAHCYEITAFLSMFDNYRATHNTTWLEAAKGAWELIKDNFVNVDGTSALREGTPNHPPKSYPLSPEAATGETCCTMFWIKLNQRFHLLVPDEEMYVAQMETAIYNALLRQMGMRSEAVSERHGMDKSLPPGIRYHAPLQGVVESPQNINTCCEGQGTRAFGSLPEYIFSLTSDGLYVNLFTASSVNFNVSTSLHKEHVAASVAQSPQGSMSPVTAPTLSWKQLESDGWRNGAFCSGSVKTGGAAPPCPKDVQTLQECKQMCLESEQPYMCMGLTWSNDSSMPIRCTLYTSIDLSAPATRALGVQQLLVVGRRLPVEIDYNASSEKFLEDVIHANDVEHVTVRLTMNTSFPSNGAVGMNLSWLDRDMAQLIMNIRLRMPTWLPNPMVVKINGEVYAQGAPGTYLSIHRAWSKGDVISCNLPNTYRFLRYLGVEQIPGYEGQRYALLVGPIVLACVGPMNASGTVVLPVPPEDAQQWLIQTAMPLHFHVKGAPAFTFKPLWSVQSGEHFTTYPIFTGAELSRLVV